MPKVLIAEDNDVQRVLLKEMLEQAGHSVAVAADGVAAEKLFRENPTYIVVTDIFMPEQEGIGLIRNLVKDFQDVKIIAISAGEQDIKMDFLPVAKRLGAIRVFSKPFDRNELLAAIDELHSGSE